MRLAIKILIALAVIIFAAQIGKKQPSLAGLIAVMPSMGLVVLLWLYLDNPGNSALMAEYTKGAFWGIIPTMLFFLVAFVCFRKNLALPVVLLVSFIVWIFAAFVHQRLLHK
jgi:uncharacterized membrane protein (GlpM family)